MMAAKPPGRLAGAGKQLATSPKTEDCRVTGWTSRVERPFDLDGLVVNVVRFEDGTNSSTSGSGSKRPEQRSPTKRLRVPLCRQLHSWLRERRASRPRVRPRVTADERARAARAVYA
jgi:hypothetical protein